jgi:hypothetical protein
LTGRLFLSGIGVLLMLVGLVFSWLMWRSFQRAGEMREWPEVEAVVLRSAVGERRIGGAPEFRFEVLYGYEWQGEKLTAERWKLRGSPWSKRPDEALALAGRLPAGSRVLCRVDPDDPSVAVLEPDTRAPGYSLWFPLLFVVGGLGVVVGAWRRRPRAAVQ